MAVLFQEWPMLYKNDINTIEARLARQARISSIVLTFFGALAGTMVLAQFLSVLSAYGR